MADLPTSRLARTARLGGLVAGQGARWAGTRAANRFRSAQDADDAMADRAGQTALELVRRLGEMKGAAMKIGQVLSTVDFDLVPEGEREAFKAELAKLRDDAPRVPFAQQRKLIERELGGPVSDFFAAFDESPAAAASIGQVFRATTTEGREVAVKVQYPGIAEAVEADLRNVGVLLPIVKRLAPGLDGKAILAEVRDRIGEELDYELEAQHQRTIARAFRGHPFIVVPGVDTTRSTRRVLVTDWVDAEPFRAVQAMDDAERDRFGEICFRFHYGLLTHERIATGDPHPGNVLRLRDGRVAFLDFGLVRHVEQAYLDGERALALAVMAGDAAGVHGSLAELGYLPEPARFDPDLVLAQIRTAASWIFEPGFKRLTPEAVQAIIIAGSSPRSEFFTQMRRQTIPAQALLLRRMESLLLALLGELRAGADWNALAREEILDEPPSTPLGREEAVWRSAAA